MRGVTVWWLDHSGTSLFPHWTRWWVQHEPTPVIQNNAILLYENNHFSVCGFIRRDQMKRTTHASKLLEAPEQLTKGHALWTSLKAAFATFVKWGAALYRSRTHIEFAPRINVKIGASKDLSNDGGRCTCMMYWLLLIHIEHFIFLYGWESSFTKLCRH